MSQSDYTVQNSNGADVRADINSQLEAIATQNSGANAPPVTFPFMRWFDTANQQLKERNSANTAWRIVAAVVGGELVPYSAGESADQRYAPYETFQNIAVFDSAGVTEWDVPEILQSGQRKAYVTVVGGGGAGGAGTSSTTVGRPGASGGWSCGLIDLSDVQSVTVTVGNRGNRVSNSSGTDGEGSSFGSYISATGGQGGPLGSGDSAAVAGVGVGGDLNFQGNNGSAQNSDAVAIQSGRPGPFGGAGAGQRAGALISSGSATAPGASGCGGYSGNNAGNGFRGIVIVRW